MRDGSEDAEAAAWALNNLAHTDDNEIAIAEAGGIALLVEPLRSGSAVAKMQAARALANLAMNDANSGDRGGGGIAPLLQLVRDGRRAPRSRRRRRCTTCPSTTTTRRRS